MLHRGIVAGALILLTACGAPRGAAFQSEVLAEANAEVPGIALYNVNRETLPRFAKWPANKRKAKHGWLSHRQASPENAIMPNDILDVVIWDTEEQSLLSNPGSRTTSMQGLKVSSNGTVFLPFAGAVQVAGLSEAGARNRIQRKMAESVPSAQVQLVVEKGPRGSVSVISGVKNPGPYPIVDTRFSVLNAVAAAGGVSSTIKNPQLRLTRGSKVYTTPLPKVLDNPKLDTVLRGGDKLTVEEDSRYFRSLGAASKEAIIPFTRDEVTALDAMSMIGGLAEYRADPKGIMILREYAPSEVRNDGSGPSDTRAVFVFDLTSADGMFSAGEFQVRTKDTVLVTESALVSATYTLGVLSRATGIAKNIDSLN